MIAISAVYKKSVPSENKQVCDKLLKVQKEIMLNEQELREQNSAQNFKDIV